MNRSHQKKTSMKLFISAGESSGELLGSGLYKALKEKDKNLEAFGITGPSMKEAGIKELESIHFFNRMGFTNILTKLSDFLLFKKKILREIEIQSPNCAILIDNQEFHKHLAEELKLRGIPSILYVAPQAWAWRRKRAETLHKNYPLVLGLLPFESTFFQNHPVNYHFVGSDVFERTKAFQKKEFQKKIKRITFFPGSRWQEIKEILPSMLEIAKKLSPLSFKMTVHLKEDLIKKDLKPLLKQHDLFLDSHEMTLKDFRQKKTLLTVSQENSLKLMNQTDFALITSGTACLECAFIGTPLVVLYKTSFLNYSLAKKLIKVPYLSLPNLILEKECLKEFIQDLEADKIVQYLLGIFSDKEKLNETEEDFRLLKSFFPESPSQKAAELIMSFLENSLPSTPLKMKAQALQTQKEALL